MLEKLGPFDVHGIHVGPGRAVTVTWSAKGDSGVGVHGTWTYSGDDGRNRYLKNAPDWDGDHDQHAWRERLTPLIAAQEGA